MKKAAVIIFVVTILLLGFHWVTYPTSHGRTFCVLTKQQLTFDSTFATADSQTAFLFQHPYLAARIAGGAGWCVNR